MKCVLQVHHPAPQGGVRVVPGHDRLDGGRLGGDSLAGHTVDEAAHAAGEHRDLQTLPVRLQGEVRRRVTCIDSRCPGPPPEVRQAEGV